jgi:hypothetical protein
VFLAFPFAFPEELDSCAGHQQVQRCGAGPVGQLHPQRLLAFDTQAELDRGVAEDVLASQPTADRWPLAAGRWPLAGMFHCMSVSGDMINDYWVLSATLYSAQLVVL